MLTSSLHDFKMVAPAAVFTFSNINGLISIKELFQQGPENIPLFLSDQNWTTSHFLSKSLAGGMVSLWPEETIQAERLVSKHCWVRMRSVSPSQITCLHKGRWSHDVGALPARKKENGADLSGQQLYLLPWSLLWAKDLWIQLFLGRLLSYQTWRVYHQSPSAFLPGLS